MAAAAMQPARGEDKFRLTNRPTAVKAKRQPGKYQLVCRHRARASARAFDKKFFSSESPFNMPVWATQEEAEQNVLAFWDAVDAVKAPKTGRGGSLKRRAVSPPAASAGAGGGAGGPTMVSKRRRSPRAATAANSTKVFAATFNDAVMLLASASCPDFKEPAAPLAAVQWQTAWNRFIYDPRRCVANKNWRTLEAAVGADNMAFVLPFENDVVFSDDVVQNTLKARAEAYDFRQKRRRQNKKQRRERDPARREAQVLEKWRARLKSKYAWRVAQIETLSAAIRANNPAALVKVYVVNEDGKEEHVPDDNDRSMSDAQHYRVMQRARALHLYYTNLNVLAAAGRLPHAAVRHQLPDPQYGGNLRHDRVEQPGCEKPAAPMSDDELAAFNGWRQNQARERGMPYGDDKEPSDTNRYASGDLECSPGLRFLEYGKMTTADGKASGKQGPGTLPSSFSRLGTSWTRWTSCRSTASASWFCRSTGPPGIRSGGMVVCAWSTSTARGAESKTGSASRSWSTAALARTPRWYPASGAARRSI
eukprot:SAG22_NODE_502_length_9704_cov_23.436439_3_plen_535_part_00